MNYSRIKKRADFGAMLITVAMIAVFSIIDFQGFFSPFTIKSILHFSALLGFIAIGQTLVLISKEVDLSVGSVYGLGGIAFILLVPYLGVILSFIAVMAWAALIGLINGLLVVKGRMPSMIATLCSLFFYRGVIYLWGGGAVPSLEHGARGHWLTRFLGGELLGLENAVFLSLFFLACFQLALMRSPFGNRLFATGGDEPSARSRGVDTAKIKCIAFICCSMLSAFAGMTFIADTPQTYLTMGFMFELEVIAAAVVGGCSLYGGRGSAIGAVLGAFIIVTIRSELIGLGAPSSWFITFVGILLIIAVLFNRLVQSRSSS